jgi:hypothetical protein
MSVSLHYGFIVKMILKIFNPAASCYPGVIAHNPFIIVSVRAKALHLSHIPHPFTNVDSRVVK